jgi:hypothetical protein
MAVAKLKKAIGELKNLGKTEYYTLKFIRKNYTKKTECIEQFFFFCHRRVVKTFWTERLTGTAQQTADHVIREP